MSCIWGTLMRASGESRLGVMRRSNVNTVLASDWSAEHRNTCTSALAAPALPKPEVEYGTSDQTARMAPLGAICVPSPLGTWRRNTESKEQVHAQQRLKCKERDGDLSRLVRSLELYLIERESQVLAA